MWQGMSYLGTGVKSDMLFVLTPVPKHDIEK